MWQDWVERWVPKQETPSGPAPDAVNAAFLAGLEAVRVREARCRALVEQLQLAQRVAQSPVPIDRATIPLHLPVAPDMLKQLAGQIKLSPYLDKKVGQVVAGFKRDVEAFRLAERAAERLAAEPSLLIHDSQVRRLTGLFTSLEGLDSSFADYPLFQTWYREATRPAEPESEEPASPALGPDVGVEEPDALAGFFTDSRPAPEGPVLESDEEAVAEDARTKTWLLRIGKDGGLGVGICLLVAFGLAYGLRGRPLDMAVVLYGLGLLTVAVHRPATATGPHWLLTGGRLAGASAALALWGVASVTTVGGPVWAGVSAGGAVMFGIFVLALEFSRRIVHAAGQRADTFMPAQCMAIDGELAQGMISLEEARERRAAVERAATEPYLPENLNRYLLAIAAATLLAAAATFGLGALLPAAIALDLAGLAWLPRWLSARAVKPALARQEDTGWDAATEETNLKDPATVMAMIGVPPLTLELGLDLVPYVDPVLGGELMDRTVPMRVNIAMELGFIMPGIQYKDNLNLRANAYRIMVRNAVVAQGELLVGYMLAIATTTTDTTEELVGFNTTEPAFGKPAVWVAGAEVQKAEKLGYLVQDPTNVLIAHLDEVVRAHAHRILSLDEVGIMVNKAREKLPETVNSVFYFRAGDYPHRLELAEYHQVLRLLLQERVSIRDQGTILETIAHRLKAPRDLYYAHMTLWLDASQQFIGQQLDRVKPAMPQIVPQLDPRTLCEAIRVALGRQLCEAVADDATLYALTLRPQVEDLLIAAARRPGGDAEGLALVPETRARLLRALTEEIGQNQCQVLVVPPELRVPLRQLTERTHPNLSVLSTAEIAPGYTVHSIAEVALGDG